MTFRFSFSWLITVLAVCFARDLRAFEALDVPTREFLATYCQDCHSGESAEAGFDVAALKGDLSNPETLLKWVRVYDRVKAGEMPPKEEYGELDPNEKGEFLKQMDGWIRGFQEREWRSEGRVRGRRLTNLQLERTLQDLLGIDIPLASLMPEESRTNGFTTVADGQSLSHFQLEQHLSVVDAALDEAIRRAVTGPDERTRNFSARELSRRRLNSRTREPEYIDETAVVWSGRLIFYGRLPATTARESGWYRFKVTASSLKSPDNHGVWCTVRYGRCVSSAPLLGWVGAFEATEKPKSWTFEAWIPKGDMLEIRPGDNTLKMARFKGGQVGTGEGGPQNVPGVAIHSIEMQRIHKGPRDEEIRARLFCDVKLTTEDGEPELVTSSPNDAAAFLMKDFAGRAFRRPVSDEDVAPYIQLVQDSLDNGTPLLEAVRGGYRALLCSPRFLYLHETPGRLDDYSLASRLSYFLWNTMPDAELLKLAGSGRLSDKAVLRSQVNRMLADERGRNFVKDFAAQWLDLSQIDFTEPDRRLYPKFDIIVQQSMLEETQAYLQTMLDENLSVGHLIDSDFTFLNSRLARFYEIDRVKTDELRRVNLQPEDRRGGLLTQGAILKVTANGTTTSPVIRGVWVSERILGEHVPPPPTGVPAIEPDIRGATSIRDMLAKHRSQPSCASCHTKVDPAGFALENFDPAGQWRDHYGGSNRGRRSRGLKIDASYELADGRKFENVAEFQKLILTDSESLAENVAEKLLTYGTGAPVTFADRKAVEEIARQAAKSEHGFRDVLLALIEHPIFLSK